MTVQDRDRSILTHILNYCRQIDETIQRFGDRETFVADTIFQNAVAMCLLQIGELAGHLSEGYRLTHSQVPWRQIKALRNIIAHNYGSIDAETAWEIVESDIPNLRTYCIDELSAYKS